VHPKDRRYKKRIGRNVLIPIINKPIPVIADEKVQIEFGTGALKITPAHAEEDFHIAQRHDLPMDQFALDRENIFTENA
jgi:valyl-tRNA synthetase